MLEVAVISDTHMPKGGRRLPAACVQRLKDAHLILHAGDFIAAEVLQDLQALGPPVHAVYGNVDSPAIRAALPATRIVKAGPARIGMIHDAGPRDGRVRRLRKAFPDCDAVIFGHSHLPLHESDGTFQIFNPGSPTERRRAPQHTMGMATIDDGGGLTFEIVTL